MLDLNHPMTIHILAASHAEDAVLIAAKRMTAVCRQERVRLQANCAPAFVELRRLSREHFANRSALPPAIDELELALSQLAELPGVPEQAPPAEHRCPACGTALERCGKYGGPAPLNPTDIYCSSCLDLIMPSLCALRSMEGGFGTDAI